MQSHGARKLPSTHIYIYIYVWPLWPSLWTKMVALKCGEDVHIEAKATASLDHFPFHRHRPPCHLSLVITEPNAYSFSAAGAVLTAHHRLGEVAFFLGRWHGLRNTTQPHRLNLGERQKRHNKQGSLEDQPKQCPIKGKSSIITI